MNKNSKKGGSIVPIIIVLVVILVICIIAYFIFNFINRDTVAGIKTKEFIRYIHDAKVYKKVSNSSIPSSAQGNEYNINFWIYINDYTYRYSDMKCIMNKGEVGYEDLSNPGIWLLPNTNTFRVQVGLETGVDKCTPGLTSEDENEAVDVCDIEDIPLQRWLNFNVSLYNSSLDIFMNGKLHKSCHLKGFPKVNNGHMHICNNGGFNGFISNVKFTNKALPLNTIEGIYKSGPTLQ